MQKVINDITPALPAEAASHPAWVTPPADGDDATEFKKDVQDRMTKLAGIAVAKAESHRDADEEKEEIAVLKQAIFSTKPIASQTLGLRTRVEKITDQIQQKSHKVQLLQEEIEDQQSEKAELELLIKSMEDARESEPPAGNGGGQPPPGGGRASMKMDTSEAKATSNEVQVLAM